MSQELQGCPRFLAYLDCGNVDCRGVIKVNSIPSQSYPLPNSKVPCVILGNNMSNRKQNTFPKTCGEM